MRKTGPTVLLGLLAMAAAPITHAFVRPSNNVVVSSSSSQLYATVSPTATPEFQQLLETIRQNHNAKVLDIQPASTTAMPGSSGDAVSLLSFMKDNAPAVVAAVQEGRVTSETLEANKKSLMDNLHAFDGLKANLQHMESPEKMFHLDTLSVDQLSSTVLASADEFSASLEAVKALFLSGRLVSADEITQALNLKDTAGWYMGASMLALGVAGAIQEVGRSVGSSKASSTAAQAAETSVIDTAALEAQVDMLNSIVDQSMSDFRGEESRVDSELVNLKMDLQRVQSQLDQSNAKEKELRASLKKTQTQLKKETGDLRMQLQRCFEVEQDLRDRLKEAEKKLTNEKRKLTRARNKAKDQLALFQEKVIQLESEKKEMEKEMKLLKEEVLSLRKQVHGETDDIPLPVMASDLTPPEQISEVTGGASVVIPKKKAAAKRKPRVKARELVEVAASASSTLPTTVESDEMLVDLSNSFFMDISDPVKPVSNPPPTPKPVATTRKSAPRSKRAVSSKKKAGRAAISKAVKDWSTLAESTLKRKTIKDLKSYLEAKGQTTVDTNGKTLRKNALVEIVLSN